MTEGERDILAAVLARIDALVIALEEDESALGAFPADMAQFQAMDAGQRVASRALLKSVEQMEDQLARLFRLMPVLMLEESSRWHAQDYAHYAERLGILENSFAWTEIIKLRNRLVHDYPLQPEAQFDLLTRAHNAIPLLRRTAIAARKTLDNEGLMP